MKLIEYTEVCVKFEHTKEIIEDTFGTDNYNMCARLLAYIQYVLMNGRKLNWSMMRNDEVALVQYWINNHVIYYHEGKVYMKKNEYDKMCDILYDAYLYFEIKEID